AGVYNTTRQVGAVLGSAAIAAVISARLATHLPGTSGAADQLQMMGAAMPPEVAGPFAQAMAESMLLPVAVLLLGVVAAVAFERPAHLRPTSLTTTAGAPAIPDRSSS